MGFTFVPRFHPKLYSQMVGRFPGAAHVDVLWSLSRCRFDDSTDITIVQNRGTHTRWDISEENRVLCRPRQYSTCGTPDSVCDPSRALNAIPEDCGLRYQSSQKLDSAPMVDSCCQMYWIASEDPSAETEYRSDCDEISRRSWGSSVSEYIESTRSRI